jgi:Flp pilus assembly protein TadD
MPRKPSHSKTRPPRPDKASAGVSRWLDEGAAHFTAGRLNEAAKAYEKAARTDPGDFRASFSLATVHLRLGRPAEAARQLSHVTALRPDLFEAWHNLGAASQAADDWRAAADAYAGALALRPDADETRRQLAGALVVLGRTEEAVRQYRRLAQQQALRPWALSQIAVLDPAAATDADLAELMDAARGGAPDDETGIAVQFALGQVLERRGEDEPAWSAFAAGNRLKRARLQLGPEPPAAILAEHQNAARRVREIYTREFLEQGQGAGLSTAAPIFVVGMPRSGSTLIDQILASHPDVRSLGEAAILPPLLERPGALGRSELRTLARRYLDDVRARGWRGAGRFVDKTLENYLHVGAIALMFPRAVILHSVRNTVDTCLSCYRQLFATGAETLYDLAEIGAEYVAYRGLMDHWRDVLPGRLVDVDHEALVADPQGQIRWLVTEACGLSWNEACLSFHAATRPVRTASASQVRQPIFRTSLGRWRRYEAHLKPLLDALGPYAPAKSAEGASSGRNGAHAR